MSDDDLAQPELFWLLFRVVVKMWIRKVNCANSGEVLTKWKLTTNVTQEPCHPRVTREEKVKTYFPLVLFSLFLFLHFCRNTGCEGKQKDLLPGRESVLSR